jgi:hypothetical protein
VQRSGSIHWRILRPAANWYLQSRDSARPYYLDKCVEQLWIEPPPPIRPLKMADMSSISIADFVGMRPPRDAEPMS